MKTAITPTPPAAESALTAHTPLPWPKSECARYTNGQCMTSSCLKRGGWKAGGVVDYSKATCEAHELIAAHAAAQQRIGELEKALQPFADCEPLVTSMGNVPDDQLFLWKPSQTSKELPGISVAHIKQARRALRHPGRT